MSLEYENVVTLHNVFELSFGCYSSDNAAQHPAAEPSGEGLDTANDRQHVTAFACQRASVINVTAGRCKLLISGGERPANVIILRRTWK